MRDVVTGFYVNVLNKLISTGAISKSDSVLIVCGGPLDERVMTQVGFKDFTVTNLDAGIANHRQDAENLTYENNSFDVAIVHAGLHHCHSPHRALLEMYRVARKCAVAFESRDSLMMRALSGWVLRWTMNSAPSPRTARAAPSQTPGFPILSTDGPNAMFATPLPAMIRRAFHASTFSTTFASPFSGSLARETTHSVLSGW